MAVLFTPNDLSHKYSLNPKQQVLALTNGQIQEGICWRTDHLQDGRAAPHNICAQQKLQAGWYGPAQHHLLRPQPPVKTAPFGTLTKGLSVHSFFPSRARLQDRGRGSRRRCRRIRRTADFVGVEHADLGVVRL
jgi:hypothetical protein